MDISHWFDETTKDVKTHIDPITLQLSYYTPMGLFLHIPIESQAQGSDKYQTHNQQQVPWWQNEKYIIGAVSTQTRVIRIINMLTHDDHKLEVCCEETLRDIQQRYMQYNAHSGSYTWKRLGRVLNMNLTLEQNGIGNEEDEFDELGLRDQYYIPALHLYFNADLSVS